MAGVVITLIIFPIIVLILMGIVSSTIASQVTAVNQQQFLVNCPFPIQNGIATLNSIIGTTLNYTVAYSPNIVYVNGGNSTTVAGNTNPQGTEFNCFIGTQAGGQPNNGLLGASTILKPYGLTTFQIPIGAAAWFGDTVSTLFGKVPNLIILIYLYLQVPALVSGIFYFNIVTGVLFGMVALGIVIIIRSGGIG